MADSKISDLAAVTDVVGTDEYVLARAGASKKIDAADLMQAGNVAFTPAGSISATDTQAAVVEVSGDIDAHIADTTDAHDASAISFSPTGTISATDVQAAIAEVAVEAGGGFGSWSDYTPALTATVTPPNLGSGPTQSGRYVQNGTLVLFWATIAFGTGGSVSAGSGDYSITLPVNINASHGGAVCYISYFDSSGNTRKSGWGVRKDADEIWLVRDDSGAFTSNSGPWTWAASDSITIFGFYEAA